MRRQILITATAAALLSLCLPARALAQDDDPEVTAMAKQHFKLGLDAYQAGKYDLAIKELKKAYLLKRLPAILLNIGLTYRRTKDYDMAVYFYKKYLGEAPPDDKQRASAESAIGEIEAEKAAAQAQAQQQQQAAARTAVEAVQAKPKAAAAPAAAPAAGAAPGAPAPGAPASDWAHTPIDAVPPGKPVDIRVQMPVMKGVKVKVYFRKEGQATFDSLELKRRGNEKVARIPQTVADGRTFQYYVEARDTAGTIVKSSGSEASPNIVLIDPGARPQVAGAAAEGPDDEELAAKPKKGFSRDIENESASLDSTRDQQRAMARLREQMGKEQEVGKKGGLGLFGKIGVGLLAGGGLSFAGGLTLLGLAQSWGELVSQDWDCQNKVRPPGGASQCPHFGDNETKPGFSLSPATATYDAQGRIFNDAGLALTVVGGVALAGGAGMLVADVIKRKAAERAAMEPKVKKKRKVKKVVEVEEEATSFNLAPVISPTTLGLTAELRF